MKIDLSGLWQVSLSNTERPPAAFENTIHLPGTTSCAGLGTENTAAETGNLTDAHPFSGIAWYRRQLTLPPCDGSVAVLCLERTRMTRVFFDGEPLGKRESLCTPHLYVLPRFESGTHTLTVAVDNAHYTMPGGHMVSPDTQSNWNGITGEISLTISAFYPEDLTVFADKAKNAVHVSAHMLGPSEGNAEASLQEGERILLPWHDHMLDAWIPLSHPHDCWDDRNPVLYSLSLFSGGDAFTRVFGFRALEASGRSLRSGGREVFLRGKTESLIFPKTGFAPCDFSTWERYLDTIKSYGINHLRCHTCCPPEAAFAAADRAGVYIEAELPFWGTLKDLGGEEYAASGQKALFEEGLRILSAFGHHPSFALFSLGNELWGSRETMAAWIKAYRTIRPDLLYLSGSNNFFVTPSIHPQEDVFSGVRLGEGRLIRGSFAMCDAPLGPIQTNAPGTDWDYDRAILADAKEGGKVEKETFIQRGTGVERVTGSGNENLVKAVPILSHEVGQYTFYPDFDEEAKYTGPLKARYFGPMAERLRAAGLWDDRKRFFDAAGRLSADCYRAEMEAALRSRELAGFQLLDLQDFPGQGIALVGILNAFMENKGIMRPEEWRQSCADTVALARLPGFVFTGGEMRFSLQVSSCSVPSAHEMRCALRRRDGTSLCEAAVSIPKTDRRLSDPVPVCFSLPSVAVPETCQLVLSLEDGTVNRYSIALLPDYPDLVIGKDGIREGNAFVRFVSSPEEASGGPVLVIPNAEGKLPASYAPDFWCYPMFKSISQSMGKPEPLGTMGLSVDAAHPLLHLFPTENYTTPVWYDLLCHAHCESVKDARMIVQMIDNPYRCGRFGILYEQEDRLYLTSRLWEAPQSASVKAFAASLVRTLCAQAF